MSQEFPQFCRTTSHGHRTHPTFHIAELAALRTRLLRSKRLSLCLYHGTQCPAYDGLSCEGGDLLRDLLTDILDQAVDVGPFGLGTVERLGGKIIKKLQVDA